ncbi:MAG: ribulose-phosphate 3-epimerase [Candidatus Pacebacteria bacterium]|jgi:ribulose-phosphate 3-epimerase|nr:ribulose-phosphate 3-epimerase [Candidatus Paceibacterota bacterium]|tara:strand:- start:12441 stop:13088 length:648 start_codon:yes stop_codon:yes gene_type:complete
MAEIEVIPAIMPESLNDLSEKHSRVSDYVGIVQIDVMDGKFVPSVSWPYLQGLSLDKIDFDFEVDLMVENPEEVVEDWIKAGAKRVIVHIESTENIENVFLKIPSDIEVGIALNTETPNEKIYPLVEKVDFVQFMGIEKIGYQGQNFDERVLDKISDLRGEFNRTIISVDGGVNLETASQLIKAGANRLVSGSAIFKNKDIGEAVKQLQNVRHSR